MMKKKSLVALILSLVVVAALVILLIINGDGLLTEKDKNTYKTVDIVYDLKLKFPVEYFDAIIHEQEIYGKRTTEVFSMRNGDSELSLFRIDFGDENAGDWVGVLEVAEEMIPVTCTGFAITSEELAVMDEKVKEQYFALMDGFTDALNTIASDRRFSAEKPVDLGGEREAQLKYFSVKLPGNMSWEETSENGEYKVVFYGDVAGEKIALYAVHIGDISTASVLGQYKVDKVNKTVSVESYDLSGDANWVEDDYSLAYLMMDTINDVIKVITSSKNFSELDSAA